MDTFEFKYGDRVVVTKNGFYKGARGMVVDYSEQILCNGSKDVTYGVNLDGGAHRVFNADQLERLT